MLLLITQGKKEGIRWEEGRYKAGDCVHPTL